MSRARAPGKLVLSGAYAVLSGAPAIVAAVDRYVTADSARPASFLTPEVRAAIGDQPAPWFNADDLRENGEKLGLGSSAAILVASLAALELDRTPGLSDAALSAAAALRDKTAAMSLYASESLKERDRFMTTSRFPVMMPRFSLPRNDVQ